MKNKPTTTNRMNSGYIKDLNVKGKTVKLIEDRAEGLYPTTE